MARFALKQKLKEMFDDLPCSTAVVDRGREEAFIKLFLSHRILYNCLTQMHQDEFKEIEIDLNRPEATHTSGVVSEVEEIK